MLHRTRVVVLHKVDGHAVRCKIAPVPGFQKKTAFIAEARRFDDDRTGEWRCVKRELHIRRLMHLYAAKRLRVGHIPRTGFILLRCFPLLRHGDKQRKIVKRRRNTGMKQGIIDCFVQIHQNIVHPRRLL